MRRHVAMPHALSALLVAFMVVQAGLGLHLPTAYRDVPWIRATWFGNDWVTLTVAAPFLTAALLLARDATVTLAHSKTKELAALTREADILVAAVGRVGLVTPEMVKPGAVVLDVGITRVTDKSKKSGFALRGDVHPDVAGVAGYLTPVPGGVGPMTVAMLMQNTLVAAARRRGGRGS